MEVLDTDRHGGNLKLYITHVHSKPLIKYPSGTKNSPQFPKEMLQVEASAIPVCNTFIHTSTEIPCKRISQPPQFWESDCWDGTGIRGNRSEFGTFVASYPKST